MPVYGISLQFPLSSHSGLSSGPILVDVPGCNKLSLCSVLWNCSCSALSGNCSNPAVVPGFHPRQCLSCMCYRTLTHSPKHQQMSLVLFTGKLENTVGLQQHSYKRGWRIKRGNCALSEGHLTQACLHPTAKSAMTLIPQNLWGLGCC